MIFLDGLTCYLGAWFGAFSKSGRVLAPLRFRRLLFLSLTPLGFALFLLHGLCLTLDNLLYPAFRRTPIKKPLFVLGIPRSGTTYLHRQLARDTQFTTTSSWELLFAPAICQRRLLHTLAHMDSWIGSPGRRLRDRLIRSAGSGLDAVHPIAADAAEEDYLALLPAAGCFFASLAFPASSRLRDLSDLSLLPNIKRQRLLSHYHRLLQRHVYVHGGAQLLSKNAAFASWAPYLQALYPDALLIVCIRQPEAALSSQLSSIQSALTVFASYPQRAAVSAVFSDHYGRWFQLLAELAKKSRVAPLVIEQEHLRRHADAVMQLIYHQLSRDVPAALNMTPTHGHASRHEHSINGTDLDLALLQQTVGKHYAYLVNIACEQRQAADHSA